MTHKLCIDCKWFYKKWFTPNRLGNCRSPYNIEKNYIDREIKYDLQFAASCRLDRCGPDAKWFKAK